MDNLLSGGHGQLQVPFSNTLSTPMMVFMNMVESLDNDYGYNQNEHKLAITSTTNTVSFLSSNRVEEWQSGRDSLLEKEQQTESHILHVPCCCSLISCFLVLDQI